MNGDNYFCKKASSEVSLGKLYWAVSNLASTLKISEETGEAGGLIFFEFLRYKQASLNHLLTCELLIEG